MSARARFVPLTPWSNWQRALPLSGTDRNAWHQSGVVEILSADWPGAKHELQKPLEFMVPLVVRALGGSATSSAWPPVLKWSDSYLQEHFPAETKFDVKLPSGSTKKMTMCQFMHADNGYRTKRLYMHAGELIGPQGQSPAAAESPLRRDLDAVVPDLDPIVRAVQATAGDVSGTMPLAAFWLGNNGDLGAGDPHGIKTTTHFDEYTTVSACFDGRKIWYLLPWGALEGNRQQNTSTCGPHDQTGRVVGRWLKVTLKFAIADARKTATHSTPTLAHRSSWSREMCWWCRRGA
jgi:hypothetical protein